MQERRYQMLKTKKFVKDALDIKGDGTERVFCVRGGWSGC